MGRTKHNTTKRGTQKQRAKLHDAFMEDRHNAIWSWARGAEYRQAMGPVKIVLLEDGVEPYNVNHIMEA